MIRSLIPDITIIIGALLLMGCLFFGTALEFKEGASRIGVVVLTAFCGVSGSILVLVCFCALWHIASTLYDALYVLLL